MTPHIRLCIANSYLNYFLSWWSMVTYFKSHLKSPWTLPAKDLKNIIFMHSINGAIHKPRWLILGCFWTLSWALLLNKASVVKWSFWLSSSPNWSRGLWMPPIFVGFFGSYMYYFNDKTILYSMYTIKVLYELRENQNDIFLLENKTTKAAFISSFLSIILI